MTVLRGAGRGRAFLRFVFGALWVFVAYFISDKAAHGFAHGALQPLLRNLFEIFLLLLGHSYMEMAWDNSREPLRAIGLVARPGQGSEFALGAAVGWGMVTATLLVIALAGHFYVKIATSTHAWIMLGLQLLVLASGALAAEIAFRGYPFQKLIQSTGPVVATILAGVFFAVLSAETPGATPTAMWISGVAAVLLSVAYLRTHALWICWGLHFAWIASIGLLFGQPLAGIREATSVIQTYVDGPTWLTGSEYGPEGSLVALIVLWLGLYVLVRVTRDLAWRYTQPELKPAGIPMDLSHPMHPAVPPPSAASAPVQSASSGGLVQIAALNSTAAPPADSAPPEHSASPSASLPDKRSEEEPS